MIGVVVWASSARQKAVIWCEDQGALAYLQGQDNLVESGDWPTAGDLVELETRMEADLRHAYNVRMITENWCPDLPERLRSTPPAPKLRVVSDRSHEVGAGTITRRPAAVRMTRRRAARAGEY